MLGDQREAITTKANKYGYLDRFGYDIRDPYVSDILQNDPVLSYFKYERKTNYKPGMYDSLGLFENRSNFTQFYWSFVVQGTLLAE